jgi:hypothetical protein
MESSVPSRSALFFPKNVSAGDATDEAIERIVPAVACLSELVIYLPFSLPRLPAWLAMRSASL